MACLTGSQFNCGLFSSTFDEDTENLTENEEDVELEGSLELSDCLNYFTEAETLGGKLVSPLFFLGFYYIQF